MSNMKTPGDYALLYANGMAFADVIRLHAHELAEQQRTHARTLAWWSSASAVDAIFETADLIDPEVNGD